ncbi:MAG: Bax inhibitor-1 family protein [Chloroflexi bacterium]|nr:Bax inhibitor-1 family protein [Chloroflexota bacterium]MBU1750320.1 Bax inhibitor-1 family protein [Chloroflexota bacterium]
MLDSLPLIGKVFLLLAPSIALGGLGAWLGRNIKNKTTIIVLTIAALVMFGIFGCVSWSGTTGLALVLMFAFTFMTGLTLGPALNYYNKSLGWQTVAFAFVATSAVAAGAGAVGYALGGYITNSPLGFILLLALLGLLGLMAVVMLFRLGSTARIITSIIGTLIFSVYILYDFARAATGPNTWDNAMRITVDLYLNLMNLLLQLLSLLSETQQRDSLLHGVHELARITGPLLGA